MNTLAVVLLCLLWCVWGFCLGRYFRSEPDPAEPEVTFVEVWRGQTFITHGRMREYTATLLEHDRVWQKIEDEFCEGK
jgi:hypothetical protein